MELKDQYREDNLTREPFEYYLKQYQNTSPYSISENIKLPYYEEEHAFFIRFLGDTYKVSYPEFVITHETQEINIFPLEENIEAQILLLRYLLEGNALMYSGRMLSYHDLPCGEVYYRQFHGRCIQRLARTYGNNIDKFNVIMKKMRGEKKEFGDVSYEFEFLEGLHLCFILWEGDEEFSPSAQILFSDNFPLAFSAEDVAYVGDIVIDHMKKIWKQVKE